jgi:hypothetical protein
MAVLTTTGRTAMAIALRERPLHLAWGTGDPAWDASPIPESLDATTLTNELGRVAASVIGYAVPDPIGLIEVPTGFFTWSDDPTNHIYLRFDFGFADEADQVIREAGLYIDSVIQGGLPEGQRYFTPAEVSAPGRLVALEHFPAIIRSPLRREQFEFVLTI